MVTSGQAPTTFNNNTQHGIYVTGAGVINITGFPVTVPAPNGQGTVVASGNAFAGLRIFEAPGAAALSTINGFVAWQNAQNGLRLYGGEQGEGPEQRLPGERPQRRLRDGVRRDRGGQRPVADRSRHDASDPGRNVLQAAVGSMPDLAGLCVGMSPGRGLLTLSARGNVFAGPTDCATSTAAVVRSTVCGGFVDLGVVPATGTTVTVDVASCQ